VKLLALHAFEGPIDGALEPRRSAEAMADIDREVLELLKRFDVVIAAPITRPAASR